MSGDAQPRKRKDKKKKKEDSVEEDFFVPLKHSTDEVIHLQKDITFGGNVVTKLIFFGLLATIGVMVGFILLEYRGSTDEETSSAVDSPWSVTFHDWVDVADTGHGNHRDDSVEEKEENESQGDEELFPEAREALRREAEEMQSKAEEINKEELSEKIEENLDSDKEESDDGNEETEGTGGDDEIAPSIETIGVPSEQHEPITETPVVASAPIKTESASYSIPPPQPDPEPKFADEAAIEEVSADEESPVEEGSPVEEEEEEEEEEQEDEGLGIDQQKFRDLLAKYGQDTPESSDIEHTDEERVDYSEGDESPAGDEGLEQEAVVSEDEAGSEDDLKEWTGIKKSDIQVETDSEDEEVEEESEDEPPPPPPQPSRKRGGQRDMDEDYGNALITNEEDWAIKEELDRADEEFNYEGII